jgi:superfamily II DNA or RNA helicase
MNHPTELPLFGFAKPRDSVPTFLIPVFGDISDLWIQDGKAADGLVSRFFPCSVPHESIIPEPTRNLVVRVGDALIYAFQFSNRQIEVGPKTAIQRLLSSRLDEFRNSPFLLIDVLRFINKVDGLPEAVRNAAEQLALDDNDIAERWVQMMELSPKSVSGPPTAMTELYQLTFQAPRRTTLALLSEERVQHPIFGETLRRRLFNLARLYDPRVPLSVDVAEAGADVERVAHPLEWVMAEGPRPDSRYCFQRLRALWLVTENRSGQVTNDPVLPFRHQAALLQFLTQGRMTSRALIADEVGLGKTVEAGLLIRHILRQCPSTRVLYLTLGGLVTNVLEEFQRLDLPRFHFFANIDEQIWRHLNAMPTAALAAETQLVVASMHKLCESERWKVQHEFLGQTRFDLVVVDECHTLRAYGTAADSPQVWFRSIRQLLEEHLTAEGRVIFLSGTPHQGKRDVFLNLVALCLGTPLNASEEEKARAARGRVVFRVKEHVRDWEDKRIFPVRDVREPRLAEPPANYQEVLLKIGLHFDWIASTSGVAQARTVGFVKSQALQYAASSLRAGFAYLLRRLIRYHPEHASDSTVLKWAARLLPYRDRIADPKQLMDEWVRELRIRGAAEEPETIEGELSDDSGPDADLTEVPRLLDVLARYDRLFDDPAAGAKFNLLFELLAGLAEPIVIFSQAVDTVYELEQRLKLQGLEVYRLTGDMLMEDRPAMIRAFCRSTNPRRVLISSAAGGVGINLQVARVVVHFDLPWNPMVLEQRVGRVHRIGSTRTILVETILLKGSREAEVFSRITERLQEIVRDLSADPIEREALFRRILASLDPDSLREILSGEIGLEAVGAAVEAGRKAVDEADRYMRELAAQTSERRGKASMARLVDFLEWADPSFKRVGSRLYAVVMEADGGELRQVEREADVYQFEGDETLVFDRTAASYLGLRRSQTGGLGNPQVDPLIRVALDLSGEPKSRTSTWVAPNGDLPMDIRAGDIIYVACEAGHNSAEFTDPSLRAWRIRQNDWLELDESVLEHLIWKVDWMPSRKAGELAPLNSLLSRASSFTGSGRIHYPIAAIGIRERGEGR